MNLVTLCNTSVSQKQGIPRVNVPNEYAKDPADFKSETTFGQVVNNSILKS